ncbi:MAG TPA: sensor domain-containing diguanylate cyclase [Thermodesulfovibrionales bacterium]|jgi:two-component system cell cycle response regulator|nr:sensor domain-containing diguanylate cyclase [Thermodesulfovibrionales bacterium]
MKERVVIYERQREARAFLTSFFDGRRDFRPEFAESISSLRKILAERVDPARLCIISSEEIGKVNLPPTGPPIIVIIPQNAPGAIKSAMKSGADAYLLGPFHGEDLEFKMRDILKRRKSVEDLKKKAKDLQTIIELTYLVSSTFNPQEILYLIVKKISEVIPVTRCSIVRIEGDKRYAHVASTFEDPALKNIKLDLTKYPEIRKALSSREPVVVKDVNTDPLMERVKDVLSPLGIRSIVVIPIIFHEEIIGTLFLRTSRRSSSFSETEISLCNAIANVSANALYNAFLFEKIEDEKSRLEKLAITDFLTGVFNIRYFYHRLTEEFSRSERYGLSLSCLMVDIDHFKNINDTHGHRIGDLVLREFAQLLRKYTRKSDVLARYGGEEFIILLTQTSHDGAVAKAEALRSSVEKYRFHSLKGKRGPTVSIGVVSYPTPLIKTKDDLITFADDALYEAKTSGRNRVIVYKP